MSPASPNFQKHTLKGHRKQVLCLAHSSERLAYYSDTKRRSCASCKNYNSNQRYRQHQHPSLLLSGSEDGTARLWDLRMGKTSFCMIIPQDDDCVPEVTSVAFHPSVVEDGECDDNYEDNDIDMFVGGRRDCTV